MNSEEFVAYIVRGIQNSPDTSDALARQFFKYFSENIQTKEVLLIFLIHSFLKIHMDFLGWHSYSCSTVGCCCDN